MPTDRRDARREALAERLAAEHLDGLIVTHPANVRYLSDFTGSAAVLLMLGGEAVLVTDFRYRTQAGQEVGGRTRVETARSDVWERVWRVVRDAASRPTLGFESGAVTVEMEARFAEADPPCDLRPVAGVVEWLRERKDPAEVEAIRGAAALAGEAFAAVLPSIRSGRSERSVAAELEHALRTRGSEWHPFETIVASGPRSALPHARTGGRIIESGDLVLLDFGARLDGYCADLSRTVVVGRADERQRTVYGLVREAQTHARAAIRAGMTGKDADALARTVIAARGFGDAFGHSLGHGLGLEVHEGPRVSASNGRPLPANAVVTIEPGIYLPGWGGVRIEDDVHLAPDGPQLLSNGHADLLELR